MRQSNYVNSEDVAPPISPLPSEAGNLRLQSHGSTYVSSVHWAAILDSISELNDVYETEREGAMLASTEYIPHSKPPALAFCMNPCRRLETRFSLQSQPRPVVDRMVARYFNTQGVAPGTF